MKNETDFPTRRSLLGQAVGAVGIASVLAQAQGGRGGPRVRESFDFGWKFLQGDAPVRSSRVLRTRVGKTWTCRTTSASSGPVSENAPARGQGGYLPTGIGWYRKHFTVPESYSGRKVSIEFDGVYQLSEVWINGQYLGKRPYGYIGFYYDLTPHLKHGGDNVIAVKADNSHQPNCRWYSGSGIYRHTWLSVTNQVHVAHWGTFVTTPQVDMDAAIVQVKTRVQNEGTTAAACRVTSTILDRDGNPAEGAQVSESKSIAANGEYEFVQQIRVTQPNLWSLDNPYLYKVRTSVMDQGSDSYDTVFGIRRIDFDVDRGFLLNGKQVRLNGVCLHHDGGSVGAAVPERVWERRLETLEGHGLQLHPDRAQSSRAGIHRPVRQTGLHGDE
jgi:beta-galactosidase